MRKLLFAIIMATAFFAVGCNGCGTPNEDPTTVAPSDTTEIVVDTTATSGDSLGN